MAVQEANEKQFGQVNYLKTLTLTLTLTDLKILKGRL